MAVDAKDGGKLGEDVPRHYQTAEPERLLTVKDLAGIVRLRHAKIYQMLACSQLPPSIKLGRARRWRPSVVQKWLELEAPSLERFLALTGGGR